MRRLVLTLVVGWVTLAPRAAWAACASTAPLSCGVAVGGTIAAVRDVDCFTFQGTLNDVVSIAAHEVKGANIAARWTLLDPDDASVGAGNFSTQKNLKLPKTGAYTIQVIDNGNNKTGGFDVGYTVVSASAASCATSIVCGSTIATSLALPTQSDTYSFAAQAGEVVTITTAETGPGLNACWELYDAAGTSLAAACVEGTVPLPSTGTYTIRAHDNGDDGSGNYDLDLDFVSATPSSCAAPLTCGESLSGLGIAPVAESDMFSFTTGAGASVRITTSGAGGAFDPCWTLYAAPAAGPTPADTPTPVCGQADVTLPNAGTHVIRVADAGDDATGSYGLDLQCLGTPTPTATPPPTVTGTPTATHTATPAGTPTLTPTATSETPTPTPTLTPLDTDTPTASPSLTPTDTATASGAPTPTPTPTPSGPQGGLADPVAAKLAVKCQKSLLAVAGKLFQSRRTRVDTCVAKLFACVELQPNVGTCGARATTACIQSLAKLPADASKASAKMAKACAALPPADLAAPAGLGFDAASDVCAGLGTSVADATDVAVCTSARQECGADDLTTVAAPRSGELLRLISVPLSRGCLADLGGTGASLGDPTGVGKQVVACAQAVTKAARALGAARLSRLAACVDLVYACIQLHPGDGTCQEQATTKCVAALAKVPTIESKLAAAIDKRCAGVPMDAIASASGFDLGGLAAICSAVGGVSGSLADYEDCLQRSHACGVADLVEAAAPRAGELLEIAGQPLRPDFCPAP